MPPVARRARNLAGAGTIELGIASKPFRGEDESGDMEVVVSSLASTLIGVVDGVGHGREAAIAASIAVESLREHASEPLAQLMQRCHAALSHTRGVAIGLASLSGLDETLTWGGIGNVQGRLVRQGEWAPNESMMLPGGIAGHQLPEIHPSSLRIRRGDMLLFATDGVRTGFADAMRFSGTAQRIADRLLDAHHIVDDDGLVVVARYLGGVQ